MAKYNMARLVGVQYDDKIKISRSGSLVFTAIQFCERGQLRPTNASNDDVAAAAKHANN